MLRRADHERGSVVIAVSALMLLVLIGVALVTRAQVEIRAVTAEADAMVARAGAEQGVAEVLARLASGDRGDFADGGSMAGGEYRYRATALSDTSYLVEAEGEVDGEVRAIEVTIEGGLASSPYSLFIDEYASISNKHGTIAGRIATNGSISLIGTALDDAVDLHGPDASCNNCLTTNTFPTRLSVPPPEVPTGTTRNCPSTGRFSGVIDGRGGVPFVCDRNHVTRSRVQFSGTVTVINPPLIVFVRIGLDIRIRNALINAAGHPDDFQLYGEGDDDYWWFDVWNSRIKGTLYGPGRDSLLQAASIVGPVSVGVLRITENYGLWLRSTNDVLDTGTSDWVVTSFDRVPAT